MWLCSNADLGPRINRSSMSSSTINHHSSMYGPGALVPPDVGVGLGVHAPVLLERGNQIRNELDGDDDLGADRGAHDVLGLGLLDFLVGERHHLAEGEREI